MCHTTYVSGSRLFFADLRPKITNDSVHFTLLACLALPLDTHCLFLCERASCPVLLLLLLRLSLDTLTCGAILVSEHRGTVDTSSCEDGTSLTHFAHELGRDKSIIKGSSLPSECAGRKHIWMYEREHTGDMMTCVDKRHMSHRVGGMLHHRFPNGFTDLLMDETDREVSTLTDRAFRSLCIGDDAVYNDEFTYGYSPFNCHKPLAGEPNKKTAKDTKKHGQSRSDKHESQPWKEQQKTMSQMSSFLKALSATEESYGGVFKKNGVTDSNGESWDKSALRSIQKELSEFSADYHSNLSEGHFKNHQRNPSGDSSSKKTSKDNSSKSKNIKANVKLKKLNIKNFFLHNMNHFSFSSETIVGSILPEDSVPKWYDLPFYKELTETPEKETAVTEQPLPCQQPAPEPSPPTPSPPPSSPPPPRSLNPFLPCTSKGPAKALATLAEKRCTSEGGDGTAAPWRRNRSRATSAVPTTQPRIPTQDASKQVDENLQLLKKVDENLSLIKKEPRSVEVKTVEEVNSLASTPFSICQLMTLSFPRVLSPSALELPLRPQSEAKITPEPPLKRDSYKSLASSILFNLKDNRKRVKSRYSQESSKRWRRQKLLALFTKQMFKALTLQRMMPDRPLSNDYLLSHLLQSKPEADASPMSPLLQMKKNKSPLAKKQNYPSLNLYKKTSPVDGDLKYLQVPLSPGATECVNNYLSPPPLSKDFSPSPKNSLPNVYEVLSPEILSPAFETNDLSLHEKAKAKRPPDVPAKPKRKNSIEPVSLKENNEVNQSVSAENVIKAARDAINAAKNKVAKDGANKSTDEISQVRNPQQEQKSVISLEESTANVTSVDKKEPPPVPKKTFAKSDIPVSLDNLTNGDLDNSKADIKSKNKKEASQKQGKLKHIFSARQNNYIKNQRCAMQITTKRRESDKKAKQKIRKGEISERIYDNSKNKSGVVDIVEQTKARNDLISRELRNIKKGMMSMRGNTMAKRELFSKKEHEQGKALINDNYDKAKMALEEIIFEREKRKNSTGQEESDVGDFRDEVKTNGLSASELKERLSELKDHNHMRAILSQTEPRLGETHREGSRRSCRISQNYHFAFASRKWLSVCQSPPDQASLSSKSSYFSAESTLHRNTETESNVYHSLENLIGEVDETHEEERTLSKTRHSSDRTADYYSFSDHESEPEPLKRQVRSSEKDAVLSIKEKDGDKSIKDNIVKEDETNSSASSNPVSPTFAIPALFRVKDNTFTNKLKKSTMPWSPRGSLAGVEALVVEDKNQEAVEKHEHMLIPEQEDRNSEVSPLSEGIESTATSTVETADEAASGLECDVIKVPSERSGSTCSGNDSQTGLPKPPAVLPKSEKAVLKAIKLTNRRIKKEEAHKTAQKPSHSSSSKHRSDRHKSDKSEHKSSSSSRKSGERKHKERTHSAHQNAEEKAVHSSHNLNETTDIKHASQRQSVASGESSELKNGAGPVSERQGRSSDRQVREKPEHRHYSSDRVISNVPVYKSYVGDKARADRTFQRSLSTDRYMGNKVERRFSADMSTNDRLEPRSQRIEKSLMDELQQRGRQKDKQSKESPLRRSQSIDSQSTNVLHPPNVSRQSSISSQFSRQSSMEHALVAPSFPITQRKLLQDPDSGQYFFVDMPVQVKTKTFFDPETGTYVQLPMQPPEGAVPQPSPMEVLSPSLVVYHSFVPVSLSPMAHTAAVPVPHVGMRSMSSDMLRLIHT
ncbi:hypothetical protein WMY93_010193 [Mugilogobius chulae]|uniref:DUF4585 domain-containing protein n=1 Tax=Mugilogobius chulae TaxID=88201 RepID=A0AAW0PH61_9GOBI